MSISELISIVRTAVGYIAAAKEFGRDIAPILAVLKDFLAKDNPDDDDMAKVRQSLEQLRTELRLPLPPPSPGEPE